MTPSVATSTAIKKALPNHPIHELLSERWSPYGFSDRPVADADLRSLFEAARWAASSYNEQPWSFIVAARTDALEFGRILTCLVPQNQVWATAAPVLALAIVSLKFSKTGADNRAAVHDLGLATANLTVEATARGISVHPMIGILPDRARELFQIPERAEALTALAIGYAADPDTIAEDLRERDLALRVRKPTGKFVFAGTWGRPSALTRPESPAA